MELIDISKEFNNSPILQNLHLEIKQKEILGIIGMSGSGKTTLLRTIIGFYEPEEGDVIFYDKGQPLSIFANRLLLNPLFGFAPQEPSFYPKLTTEENLMHFGYLYGVPKQALLEQVEKLLKLINLENSRHRLAQNLSFGMQKRLGIGCSLIHKPNILILDEPTADLDPIRRKETWELVRAVNRKGTTVIIASHLLDEVEAICDRVAVLQDKKMIVLGDSNLKGGTYTINLQTSMGRYSALTKALKTFKNTATNISGRCLKVETQSPESVLQLLVKHTKRSKDRLVDISLGQPSLEEVFNRMLKKEVVRKKVRKKKK